VENGGGTIDSTGFFQAGTTLGNFTNTILASAAGVESTATINIIESGSGEAGSGQEGSSSLTEDYLESLIASLTGQAQVINNVIVDPAFISALSGATIPITATAVDAYGNAVSGVTYNFAIEGNLGTLSQDSMELCFLPPLNRGLARSLYLLLKAILPRCQNCR
jgi:hypothetical protein